MAALRNVQSSRCPGPKSPTGPRARYKAYAAAALFLALLSGDAVVADPVPGQRPVVVELFTSQACYSCPPAEAFLGELAERRDVIALEFHVDYWNDLVYGSAGQWKDPFSDPAYSQRQRLYAQHLESSRVYTPQMVIAGTHDAVGSRRRAVLNAIALAQSAGPHPLTVKVESRRDRSLRVFLDGDLPAGGTVWLARFKRAKVTDVVAGENKGKTLANHNIVTELRAIGDWSGRASSIELAKPGLAADEGCAILVQNADLGPFLGAAYCPEVAS